MAFDPTSAKPFNPASARPVGFNPATAKPFNPASAKPVEEEDPISAFSAAVKKRNAEIESMQSELRGEANTPASQQEIAETISAPLVAMGESAITPITESAKTIGRGFGELLKPVIQSKQAMQMFPGEGRTSVVEEIGRDQGKNIARGTADIAIGTLGVGIGLMPQMMGVNVASGAARPVITEAVTKAGGSEAQVNIANKIFDYALAAKAFGYPVVRGMAAGELFGKLAEMGVNTEADWNRLGETDKNRVIELAHNIGFFAGAGTSPTRLEKTVGAKVENAATYFKPIKPEDAGYDLNFRAPQTSTMEILGDKALPGKGETSPERATVINPILVTPSGKADVSGTFTKAERTIASQAQVELPVAEQRLQRVDERVAFLRSQRKNSNSEQRKAITDEVNQLLGERVGLEEQIAQYRDVINEVGQNVAEPTIQSLVPTGRVNGPELTEADLRGANTPKNVDFSIFPTELLPAQQRRGAISTPGMGAPVSRNQARVEQKAFYPDGTININELAKLLREAEAQGMTNTAMERLLEEVDRRGMQVEFNTAMEDAGRINAQGRPPEAQAGPRPELPPQVPPRTPEPVVFNVDEGRAKVIQDKLDRGMQLNAREIAERRKFEEAGITFKEQPKAQTSAPPAPVFNPESAKPVEPSVEQRPPVGEEAPLPAEPPAPARPVEAAPVPPKPVAPKQKGRVGRPPKYSQVTEGDYPMLYNMGKIVQPDWILRDGKVVMREEFAPLRDFLDLSEKPTAQELAAIGGRKYGNIDKLATEFAADLGMSRWEDAESFRTDLMKEIDRFERYGYVTKEKIEALADDLKNMMELEDQGFEELMNDIPAGVRNKVMARLAEKMKGQLDADERNLFDSEPQEFAEVRNIGNEIQSATEARQLEEIIRKLDEIEGRLLVAGEPGEGVNASKPRTDPTEAGDQFNMFKGKGDPAYQAKMPGGSGPKGEDKGTEGSPLFDANKKKGDDNQQNLLSLTGGALFAANQLITEDEELRKKLDFVFGAMLAGGIGMALKSMKGKSLKAATSATEEAMNLYKQGRIPSNQIGNYIKTRMKEGVDPADAKAGAKIADEIASMTEKFSAGSIELKSKIEAGVKENLVLETLEKEMQLEMRELSNTEAPSYAKGWRKLIDRIKNRNVTGQTRIMFMDKVLGMTKTYGAAGAELQLKIVNSDLKRQEIMNSANDHLNRVKEIYSEIEDPYKIRDLNKNIVSALENRKNADQFLKTSEGKEVFKRLVSIFDEFKEEALRQGEKVLEDYFPHIAKMDVVDQILSGDQVKDINKPLDQFISDQSPFFKPRFDILEKYRKDPIGVTESYIRSASKHLSYKDAVEYYRGDFRNDIPAEKTKASMELAFANLKNSLSPRFAQGPFMALASYIRGNQFTNFLSYGVAQSLENYTQRQLADVFVTPESRQIGNRLLKNKADITGTKLAEAMAITDKITPKQRKDIQAVMEEEVNAPKTKFQETFEKNDFFNKAELGNWKISAFKGIMHAVTSDPRWKETLERQKKTIIEGPDGKRSFGGELEAVNELLKDEKVFQKALREADVLTLKTQVSPLPGSRAPLNDQPTVRLFTSLKNFKIRYIQILGEIMRSMDGVEGVRARKILQRGMSEEIIPVEILREVEKSITGLEREIKLAEKHGHQWRLPSTKEFIPKQLVLDYLDFLKSRRTILNADLKKIEPLEKKSMLKALAKYHLALFTINTVIQAIAEMGDNFFYTVTDGAIGYRRDAEDVANDAYMRAIMRQSPLPFYSFYFPTMFVPTILPGISNMQASALYNKGIPTKRAAARDLVPYAINALIPFGGLIDRYTGRNASRAIVNAIAPPEERGGSNTLDMIGRPRRPGRQ